MTADRRHSVVRTEVPLVAGASPGSTTCLQPAALPHRLPSLALPKAGTSSSASSAPVQRLTPAEEIRPLGFPHGAAQARLVDLPGHHALARTSSADRRQGPGPRAWGSRADGLVVRRA